MNNIKRSNQQHSLTTLITMAILLCNLFLACNRNLPQIPDSYYRTDYYFVNRTVQITGSADIPPSRQIINYEGGQRILLRTAEKRHQICMDNAIKNAHSRWLALTLNDLQSQDEWLHRLELGARGNWYPCLQEARIKQFLIESADRCRVVMHYPCHPRKY